MGRQFMKLYCDILPRKDLTPAAKLVYTVLSDQIRGNPAGQVSIGLRRLAELTGLTAATVARAVACLAERTDLAVGRSTTSIQRNVYRLPPETVQETIRFEKESVADSVRGCVQNETPGVAKSVRNRSKNGTEPCTKRNTYQNRPENKDQRKTKAPCFSWKEIQPQVKGTCLDTPEFGETWTAWQAHRREIRKPLTATTVTRQIKRLKGYGHDAAKAALEFSIERGYQGFDRAWTEQAPGSGARAGRQDNPARVRAKNGRYDNIGTILK